MAEDVTVIVGAGLAGAAAAWALARRGHEVVVLEQFEPNHDRGSSHGSARIVRRAYGDALYVSLTGRAFELWRELELASGQGLLRMLGGLDFGDGRDVAQVAAFLADAEVEHERLPAAEAERRWPGMLFDDDVVFHPQAGTVDAARAVTAMLELATVAGAQVRYGQAVRRVEPDGDHRAIVTMVDGEQLRARTVVVAAGSWLGPLLADVVTLPPLRVTQEQVFHFPRLDTSAPAWPSVIHLSAHPVYHLAGGRDGGAGDDRKVGEHDAGVDTTAAERDGRVSDASRQRVVEYVRRWLPGLDPTPRSETTCLYTRTVSEDFLLDHVGPVVICSPCSGHGAKFAPLIGEYVATLVARTGDEAVPERFGLRSHSSGRSGAVSF